MQTVTNTKTKHVLVCADCDTPTLSCSECFSPFVESEVIICLSDTRHYCLRCRPGGTP